MQWNDLIKRHLYSSAGVEGVGKRVPAVSLSVATAEERRLLSHMPEFAKRISATWTTVHRLAEPDEAAPRSVRLAYMCAPGREGPTGKLAAGTLLAAAQRATALLRHASGKRDLVPNVYFVAVDVQRRLPELAGSPIGVQHINGGYAFVGRPDVVVYRTEDAEKVLLHELIHVFGIDSEFMGHKSAAMERRLAADYGIKVLRGNTVCANEFFVETLACYMHAHLVAARTGAPLDRVLTEASLHYIDIAHAVAEHFESAPDGHVEDTSAFSYAICRAALFQPEHLQLLLSELPPDLPPGLRLAALDRRVRLALPDLFARLRAWRGRGPSPRVSAARLSASPPPPAHTSGRR